MGRYLYETDIPCPECGDTEVERVEGLCINCFNETQKIIRQDHQRVCLHQWYQGMQGEYCTECDITKIAYDAMMQELKDHEYDELERLESEGRL